MLNFLIFIGILSVLIIAHEFGHFLSARRNGVKVERFALGFGPTLFKIKGKETDFIICLFPLGGYVKLAGDNRLEIKGKDYEFLSKPVFAKIKIVFAGPLFNYVFAFLLFWCIAVFGMTYRYFDPIIGEVKAGSSAQKSGILKGDVIVEVNSKKVETWDEAEGAISRSKDDVKIKARRSGQIIAFEVPTMDEEAFNEFGAKQKVRGIGISVYIPAVAGKLKENYPAQKAGIKEGDKILAVNGKTVERWEEMTAIISAAQDSVVLGVQRDGKEFTIAVPCEQEEIFDEQGNKKNISRIGITPFIKTRTVKYNFFKGFIKGAQELYRITSITLRGFGAMITGTLPLRDAMTGPLGIYKITADTAKLGILPILTLMAILNVSLAIINLIPLPLFDGGHILIFMIEGIRKKPISEKADTLLTRAGFVIIGLVVLFVFYNDIVRFGPGIWGKWFRVIRR